MHVPGYFRLAELILDAINRRKKVLTELVGKRLSTETRALLDELFVQCIIERVEHAFRIGEVLHPGPLE